MKSGTNELLKNIYIETILRRDYVDSESFLPAGKKIFVFPERKFIFALSFFDISGILHSIRLPMIGTMTEEEIQKKDKIGRAKFVFLKAYKLYLALSTPERKAVWPKLNIARK